MKKIINIVALSTFIILISSAAKAQNKGWSIDLNYNYSLPQGAFKSDIISDGSPRGITGGFMYSFNSKWSAGLLLGYQDYYQKYPRAIYQLDKTQNLSAVLSNSLQQTPVMLRARFAPFNSPGSFIKPYIGVAAGANFIDFNQYFGQFGNNQSSIGFKAQGGLGVLIPFGKLSSSGINLGANYDFAPYTKNGFHNLNTVNFQAGVFIPIK